MQERIKDELVKSGSMITTRDNWFKLPAFMVLRNTVDKVMKGQTALTFEKPKITEPVLAPSFQASNKIMNKMEANCRPKPNPQTHQETPTIDEITKLLQAFENKIDQKISSLATPKPANSVPKSTIVCYYCHREGHGTGRCPELQKDKEEKLVEQKGNNFFPPNGALIPFDLS